MIADRSPLVGCTRFPRTLSSSLSSDNSFHEKAGNLGTGSHFSGKRVNQKLT